MTDGINGMTSAASGLVFACWRKALALGALLCKLAALNSKRAGVYEFPNRAERSEIELTIGADHHNAPVALPASWCRK